MAFLSKETEKQLNFDLWRTFFERQIRLGDNPFFEKWYREKYREAEEFQADVLINPDGRWQRIAAILSIACDRFDSLRLPVPEAWRESHERDTFRLTDVWGVDFPYAKISGWTREFDEFEEGKNEWLEVGDEKDLWWYRKGLLDEFRSLYYAEIKKLLAKKGIKRNKALRDLLCEAPFYQQSIPLSNCFYKRVEPFLAEIKDDGNDGMVAFLKDIMMGVFVGDIRDMNRKVIVMKMLEGYWEQLRKTDKPAGLVDDIKSEVEELVDFLLLELERERH